MDCKILEIQATDGVITAARYLCSVGDVQSEGWWWFKEPGNKLFADISESDVIGWVLSEAGSGIESNLNAQAQALKTPKTVAPWLPQTFTPSI
jgi:membrane-bound lytic murein transglycosylase B